MLTKLEYKKVAEEWFWSKFAPEFNKALLDFLTTPDLDLQTLGNKRSPDYSFAVAAAIRATKQFT